MGFSISVKPDKEKNGSRVQRFVRVALVWFAPQAGSRVEAVQRGGGADPSVLRRLQRSPPSAVPAVL